MKTIAIMQPTYMPWLGYFELISRSDVFVFYDSVQFEKQSWQQRNRIRNKSGEIMFTVPVLHGAGLERKISDVVIDNSRNQLKKHLTSLKLSYSKAINFHSVIDELEEIYSKRYERLMDLNIDLIKFGMKCFNIKAEVMFSSELFPRGSRVEALIDICKKLGADHYYSPAGSKTYIDENNLFEKSNISLSYQQYSHPVYKQIDFPDFISHLAFVDYLFNNLKSPFINE